MACDSILITDRAILRARAESLARAEHHDIAGSICGRRGSRRGVERPFWGLSAGGRGSNNGSCFETSPAASLPGTASVCSTRSR